MGFVKTQLHAVQSIDFCLDDICRLDWLAFFPNLRELICCIQGITDIEGIDKCRLIEKVYLQQNSIEQIKLFDKLSNLTQLYLGSNKIKKIKGLDKCVLLEKLWLDDNRIETIEGLQSLNLLTELNLA